MLPRKKDNEILFGEKTKQDVVVTNESNVGVVRGDHVIDVVRVKDTRSERTGEIVGPLDEVARESVYKTIWLGVDSGIGASLVTLNNCLGTTLGYPIINSIVIVRIIAYLIVTEIDNDHTVSVTATYGLGDSGAGTAVTVATIKFPSVLTYSSAAYWEGKYHLGRAAEYISLGRQVQNLFVPNIINATIDGEAGSTWADEVIVSVEYYEYEWGTVT